MTKKLLLPALLLFCTALIPTSSVAQACASFTGANIEYIGVGSSAQFNTFAFAAANLLNSNYHGASGYNFWASSSWSLFDARTSLVDGGGKIWVAWDNTPDCHVYAYMSFDSTVGVRAFQSWQKVSTVVTNALVAAAYGASTNTYPACSAGTVKNAGQPACTDNNSNGGLLPSGISAYLQAQHGPTCKISGTTCTISTQWALPRPYCGNQSHTQTVAHYCFFNAGHSDVRPEDALYATTRALSAYSSTNGLTGLGYGTTGTAPCPTAGLIGTKVVGCAVSESFAQSGSFNVAQFALSAGDPYSGATTPPWVALNIGAVPVVVFVNDADTTAGGLGHGAPSAYTVTNINHTVLAQFENGTLSCVGDISPASALGATPTGKGNAVQVIQREPLSGTYNTFEFNAARILSGSAATAVAESKASSLTWFTDDDSGQEINNNPSSNWNGANCPSTSTPLGSVSPTGACGNPKFVVTHACADTTGLQLRAIGTGEMVKAVTNQAFSGQSTSAVGAKNGLGYAFWGYGNFAKAASGTCGTNTGSVTCTGYTAHYLTVDGIDPLFNNPGDSTNPNGAYHLPQCYLSSGTPTCYHLTFPHIRDGSYPIWTILRAMTFECEPIVSGSCTGTTQTTPNAVLSMIAQAENAANGVGIVLDDFIPYFTNINTTVDGSPTGDLNLGVYRTHYKNGTTTAPNNGLWACGGAFTTIDMTGTPGGCTVDVGGDVGGSVMTVQSDADFYADFGGHVVGVSAQNEIYGLHN